jgi:hypothetical protein
VVETKISLCLPAFFLAFFEIFSIFGLTKEWNGCILYDIGLRKGRCSPQSEVFAESAACDAGRAGAKIFRKIFAKRFDKAQKCAIVNITV